MKLKILMILGIVSMVTAIFATVNSAKEEQEEETEERNENGEEESLLNKAVKKVKRYWLTIALTAFAIFCFTFALHISVKQGAIAIVAAKSVNEALAQYKEAAKEVVGETKERFISNKAAEKKVEKDKIDEKPVVDYYPDENGTSLFYDPYSKTVFTYYYAKMLEVENDLNAMIKDVGFISIQDFYNVARLDLYYKHALDLGVNEIDGPVRLGLEPITLKKGEHAGEMAFAITMSVMPYYDYTEA